MTYSRGSNLVFNTPNPYTGLAVLVPHIFKVLSSKTTPGVIGPGEKLKALYLITLLCEWSDIAVKQIKFLVEALKQVFAGRPILEGHEL